MRSLHAARRVGVFLSAALGSATPVFADETTVSDQLPTVVVTASADASAQGVQPPYAGGQVARGGRVGIFGSVDIMRLRRYINLDITKQRAGWNYRLGVR